jgi:hypothetical protein
VLLIFVESCLESQELVVNLRMSWFVCLPCCHSHCYSCCHLWSKTFISLLHHCQILGMVLSLLIQDSSGKARVQDQKDLTRLRASHGFKGLQYFIEQCHIISIMQSEHCRFWEFRVKWDSRLPRLDKKEVEGDILRQNE